MHECYSATVSTELTAKFKKWLEELNLNNLADFIVGWACLEIVTVSSDFHVCTLVARAVAVINLKGTSSSKNYRTHSFQNQLDNHLCADSIPSLQVGFHVGVFMIYMA